MRVALYSFLIQWLS